MKKKIIAILILLCFLFTLMPVAAFAEDTISGIYGGVKWQVEGTTLTVSAAETVDEGYTSGIISLIGEDKTYPWSVYQLTVTDIVVEEGVTVIGGGAFREFPILRNVTLPQGIVSIGDYAFYKTGLTTIIIPAETTSIGLATFGDSPNMQNIKVAEGSAAFKDIDGILVSKDGSELYAYPSGRDEIIIPENVTTLKNRSLRGCRKVTEVTIPKSVNYIEEAAFIDCNNISDIYFEMGESLTIDQYAFQNCKVLANLHFDDLAKWCNVNIPGAKGAPFYYSDAQSIAYWLNDEKLVDLVIPDGVTTVKKCAFYRGNSIRSITLPESVISIEQSAFSNNDNRVGTWPDLNSQLQTVVSLSSQMTLGWEAFCGNYNLAHVIFPGSVKSDNLSRTFRHTNNGVIFYIGSDDSITLTTATHSNGGTDTSQHVAYGHLRGGSITADYDFPVHGQLLTPTKNGYTFAGWFTDKNCIQGKTDVIGESGILQYYAKWVSEITFDANGGVLADGTPTKIEVAEGIAIGTLPEQPTREDYTFGGWYTAKNNVLNENENIAYAAKVTENTIPIGNATYYAKWITDVVEKDENNKDVTVTYSVDPVAEDVVYTGQVVTPTVKVYKNDAEMSSDRYTVAVSSKAGVGEYKVSVSINDVGEIGTVAFKVVPKDIIIKADNKTIVAGENLPIFSYQVEGIVSSDTFTAPTITTTATDTNIVGNYDIVISGGTLTNADCYNVTYDGGKLTIEEKTVTPPADDDKVETKPSTSTGGGFSGSYNYPVSTPQPENGSVTLSDTSASAGETVTVSVKPDNGYGVAEVIVTDEKGNVIPVTYLGNGEYSFEMPEGEVNIETICKPAITLTVGDEHANVFGETVTIDAAPIVTEENRTMLLIRFIVEEMGGEVEWNEAAQTVTITKDGVVIQIIIGADYAYINGKRVELDSAAFIENNRTYLPLRFIAENLGATVNWDAKTQQVVIMK